MSTLPQFLAPLQTEIKNQQRQIRVDLRANEWKEPLQTQRTQISIATI
ncbi:hypothetical protein MICAD_2290001 [Microcystis aeruginosa PCC 7941]|nr:hypothetical protein MICAD_2290001 [Microcystis aeruginosa PCC 7941]